MYSYRLNRFSKLFLLTSLLIIGLNNNSSAQEVEEHLVYASNELNLGNYIGYSADLNYIYNEKYSAKIGLIANIRRSPNEPSNYNPGIAKILTFGLADAREVVASANLLVGRIYNLNSKKSLRVNASVGLGYTSIEVPVNFQKIDQNFLIGNYTYDIEKKNTVSFIINPKLEIPLGQIFGFTVSPTAVFNSESTYYGIGIGYMIGLIRSKP